MARNQTRQEEIDSFLLIEVATKLWLEQLLGITLERDFLATLRDGVLLCQAMLEVNERSIPYVHTADEEEDARIPFYKQKNNIRYFLEACEDELQIPRHVSMLARCLTHSLTLALDLDLVTERTCSMCSISLIYATSSPSYTASIASHRPRSLSLDGTDHCTPRTPTSSTSWRRISMLLRNVLCSDTSWVSSCRLQPARPNRL